MDPLPELRRADSDSLLALRRRNGRRPTARAMKAVRFRWRYVLSDNSAWVLFANDMAIAAVRQIEHLFEADVAGVVRVFDSATDAKDWASGVVAEAVSAALPDMRGEAT